MRLQACSYRSSVLNVFSQTEPFPLWTLAAHQWCQCASQPGECQEHRELSAYGSCYSVNGVSLGTELACFIFFKDCSLAQGHENSSVKTYTKKGDYFWGSSGLSFWLFLKWKVIFWGGDISEQAVFSALCYRAILKRPSAFCIFQSLKSGTDYLSDSCPWSPCLSGRGFTLKAGAQIQKAPLATAAGANSLIAA